MNNSTASNIDMSVAYDAFMYATDYVEINNGYTLERVVKELKKHPNGMKAEKIKQLEDMLNRNPQLKETKIISQSHTDGAKVIGSSGNKCTDDLIQGCAFQNPKGDVYVAFRGTGNGRWGDNGEGFTAEKTDMQEAARKYFDYVVQKNHLNDGKHNLYVTGHSKGGNEAQYVMMTSKYNDSINACYSIDGQGFSEDAIKMFIEKNGKEGYEELLKRMYSVNGENDYVHNLINPIIPEENTYYINQTGKDPHDIFSLLKKDGDGVISWMCDKDGNITHGVEGWLSKYSKELMDDLRKLPKDQQDACAMTIMSLLELAIGSHNLQGMDGAGMSIEDLSQFLTCGVPVAIISAVEFFLKEKIDAFGAILKFAGAGIIGGFIIDLMTRLDKGLIDIVADFASSVIGYASEVLNNIRKIVCKVVNKTIDAIVNKICDFINGVREWIFKHSQGYKDANANPLIVINTNNMVSYAQKLTRIAQRAKTLDRNMNSYYWQLGIEWDATRAVWNLGNFLRANMLLDYAGRLDKCAKYLNETAADFDNLEKDLMKIN